MTIGEVLSTVLHSRRSRQFILQSFAATALIAGATGSAEAQPQRPAPSVQRVQSTPPAEGARGWSTQDNCFYIYQGGAWRRQDWCRVMRGAAVYDTYTPSTRRWGVRMDESQPGWTGILDLNGGNPNAWFKFSNDGRTILAFDGRQWINYTAALAAQNRAATAGNPATNLGNPAGYLGGTGSSLPGVTPGAILGGGPSTPNPNPLTVYSEAARRARENPALQQQFLDLDRYFNDRYDTSIKVDTLGTYERVGRR